METTYNATATDFAQQAQALICLDAFDNICAKAKGQFKIVPLKGIDLMRFLYSDTLDRELKDIDLLVIPAERAMEFIELLEADGYRPEFSFALDKTALDKKRKVSMLSPVKRLPNVDVHLALVTKKFFSHTINSFNQDALARIKAVDDVVCILDDIDRWLYLASHLTFHFLNGDKWYRDLILLMERFDDEDMATLIKRTKQYNFERIVSAVISQIRLINPALANRIDIAQLLSDKSDKRFLRYINFMTEHPKRLGHGLRLGRYYWEFIFISDKRQRRHTISSLMCPSLGNMQNIYRCHAPLAILLYLPNMLINALGLSLFSAHYLLFSNSHRHAVNAK